jgi:hypothetical protein
LLATIAYELCIDIGGMPILVRTDSLEFMNMLKERYGSFAGAAENGKAKSEKRNSNSENGFVFNPKSEIQNLKSATIRNPEFELDVELVPPGLVSDADDVRVRRDGGRWVMERGDFRAEWDPDRRQGWVRQTANPYSIDSVLRILHSLILAREGGFLLHAASAVRQGRAFLFAGVSGAGKTTISRLAPPDVALLTDEISYVREVRSQEAEGRRQKAESGRQDSGLRKEGLGAGSWGLGIGTKPQPLAPSPQALAPTPYSLLPSYVAYGTPFAGELARIGENLQAPVAALYLLAQGPENRIEPVSDADAGRALLQHILFFAQDADLVRRVFKSAFDFVSRVPVRRLVFAPNQRVWELIN